MSRQESEESCASSSSCGCAYIGFTELEGLRVFGVVESAGVERFRSSRVWRELSICLQLFLLRQRCGP